MIYMTMNTRRITLIIFAVISFFAISSCLKDDSEEKIAKEKSILKEYIASNNITQQPTASGLYYIETLAGTGDSAKLGTWMEIKYTGYLVTNNNVIMTSDSAVAKNNNIYSASSFYGPTRIMQGYISYAGLNEGFSKMREGGKARLIFPSDLGLGSRYTANIPAYSSLIFDVELVKVIPDIRSYEGGLMMAYLDANEISKDSINGIFFRENTPGTGDYPVKDNQVSLTYTGKFLNGRVFDTSDKYFSLKIGSGQYIKGFEEGVKLIRAGGSGTVVIPYYHAYGEFGLIDQYTYRTIFPPFTTIVFDISVTTIAK